jgi:hypothetical protein
MERKDRAADGKFTVGNAGGPGNPHARATARLRSLLLETVSEDDFRAVCSALVRLAREGNLGAITELLNRTVGKPTEAVNPDELDVQERRLLDERFICSWSLSGKP